MNKTLRIATRKSELALIQTNKVKALLLKAYPNLEIELVYFSTKGDEVLDRPLADIGGKGLFIKTLEEALIQGKADIAVHSLKDVPSVLADPFSLVAYLPRENPRDVFLSKNFSSFSELPIGASIGTSSPRRAAQLKNLRPDLNITPLRGNVPTRVAKILSGEFDAGVLAYAGLSRLNLTAHIREIFSLDYLTPSAGQGIIGVECLANRTSEFEFVREVLNSKESEAMALAERSFVAKLEGDCYSPIAALAEINNAELNLVGAVFSRDGSKNILGSKKIKIPESLDLKIYSELGALLARELLARGALELFQC